MFEQKFAFSPVIFVHMRQFHFDFFSVFRSFGSDFILNGPNLFIVQPRLSFF